MKRRTFLGIALAAAGSAWKAVAGIEDGWKELGRRTVDLGLDRDVIDCMYSGRLKALCLEVQRNTINFLGVKVFLLTGEELELPVKSTLRPGQRSRVFDIPGSSRTVKRVEFWYKSVSGKKAEVILWGKE